MEPMAEAKYITYKLQKELISLNVALKGMLNIEQDIKKIFEDAEQLKSIVENNAASEEIMKDIITSESMISLFKDVKAKALTLTQNLQEYQTKFEDLDLFLERYRNYRLYSFKENAQFMDFVEDIARAYNITEFWIKPELSGAIKLRTIAGEMQLPQEGKMYVRVEKDKLKPFFEALWNTNPTTGVYLESENLTLLWKPNKIVKINIAPKEISSVDSIARAVGMTLLDV